VLSGRGLCDELITLPEESYRLCCVVVCDLETSRMGAPYIYDICRLRVNTVKILNFSSIDLCYVRNKVRILFNQYKDQDNDGKKMSWKI